MEEIDMIIEKGKWGEQLNTQEIELLMHHALDLLESFRLETLKSINRTNIENELSLLLKSTINELTCLDNLIDKIRQDITDHEFKQAA